MVFVSYQQGASGIDVLLDEPKNSRPGQIAFAVCGLSHHAPAMLDRADDRNLLGAPPALVWGVVVAIVALARLTSDIGFIGRLGLNLGVGRQRPRTSVGSLHKGQPSGVKKRRKGRRNRLKGARGRGTLAKEQPPIFGMVQRGGQMGIRILEDVRQTTSQPLIEAMIRPGTLVLTDEYTIYKRLPEWGFEHQTVCHNAGEDARDEDDDGFHEIHVNTMEGFWSLLRSWFRPHREISQEHLPLYLGFFEFVHNAKNRGKGLLDSLGFPSRFAATLAVLNP